MKPKIGFIGTTRENIINELHFAIQYGFDFYEIQGLAKNFDLEPNYIKEIKELCEENNISLNLHIPYFLPISSVIPEVAGGVLKFAKKEITLAKKVGAKIITIHSGSEEAPERKLFKLKNFEVLIQNLREITEFGKGLGIKIGLENSWKSPALCRKPGDMLSIVNSVKGLGIVFDVGHANAAGYNPSKYFKKVKKFIINMHIHDNNGKNDQHNLIGKGNINFKTLFKECKESNYYGPFILELFPLKNNLKGKERVLNFWGQI